MPSYETLDAIADSYNPLLLVISIGVIGIALYTRRWRLALMMALTIVVGAAIAYGVEYFDHALQIWPRFGLDYSTHTATAVVLVVFLSMNARRLIVLWVGSLHAYFGLMLYQRYHTVGDILTTLLAVVMPIVLATWYLRARAMPAAS